MLYTEDFSMRHYVGYSQIGSHIYMHTQMEIQHKYKTTSQQENTITNILQIIPTYNKN